MRGHGVLRVGAAGSCRPADPRTPRMWPPRSANWSIANWVARRQVLGVHQHQHVDGRVDAGDGRVQHAHVHTAAAHCSRTTHAVARLPGLRIETRRPSAALTAMPPTGFFGSASWYTSLTTSYSRNCPLFGIEEIDRRVAVGGVGAGEAEVQLAAGSPDVTARTPSSAARSSSAENGCGSTTCRMSLPLERAGELVQELTHAVGVALDLRMLAGGLGGVEEVQVDRLLDAGGCGRCRARWCTGGSGSDPGASRAGRG